MYQAFFKKLILILKIIDEKPSLNWFHRHSVIQNVIFLSSVQESCNRHAYRIDQSEIFAIWFILGGGGGDYVGVAACKTHTWIFAYHINFTSEQNKIIKWLPWYCCIDSLVAYSTKDNSIKKSSIVISLCIGIQVLS